MGKQIYRVGNWKEKRRTWRKLHIAINPDAIETVSIELTEANIPSNSSSRSGPRFHWDYCATK